MKTESKLRTRKEFMPLKTLRSKEIGFRIEIDLVVFKSAERLIKACYHLFTVFLKVKHF